MNDQDQEFNRFSEKKNHKLTIRSLLKSRIEKMEKDLIDIGMQIKCLFICIQSNISFQKVDFHNKLTQEK